MPRDGDGGILERPDEDLKQEEFSVEVEVVVGVGRKEKSDRDDWNDEQKRGPRGNRRDGLRRRVRKG